MEGEEPKKRKRSRVKLRCLVCKDIFDEDYRGKHNRKYHMKLIKENKFIPYEQVDAPANPFVFSQRQKVGDLFTDKNYI